MSELLLNTSSATFGELIGNGKIHKAPPFQRDYSWKEEHWDDLWFDILELTNDEKHYMGYVVFQIDENDINIIIDGQQRFATLSIFALAIIKNIDDLIESKVEPEQNQERILELRNRFLGYKDPASLIPTSKLFLNRNNDNFYQSFLLRLRKPSNTSKLKPSEKLLCKAFQYFYDKIKEHFGGEVSGEKLASFLNEKVAKKLIFTTITVSDDLNAYKVFETLNARGVKLSTSDLLKNYLFSLAATSSNVDLNEAERQWQNINDLLQSADLPTYLRHFWNSRNLLARKQNLFKSIKNGIKSAESVFALLNDLEKLAPVYVAFSNASDSIWNKQQSKHIEELILFNVSQCYSLLLSAYEKFDANEYAALLRDIAVISFRYNVIGGLNPNILEDKYNKTAIKIFKGEIKTAKEIAFELKGVYVDDNKFSNDFESKMISSKRYKNLVRYILFSIENQVAPAEYDFTDAKATIEHILPENPPEHWEEFFKVDEQENYIYRLGNTTLIEEKKNNNCGTKPFNEKLIIYKTSSYKITNEHTNYTEWMPDTLRKRQTKMAGWATTVWKINY